MRRFDVTTISCVDLFCGAGGLTHGFVLEGLLVGAGIDLDPACRFPYETNNQARFVERDISKLTTSELKALFGDANLTILAGCAPCQPFSTYAKRYELDGKDGKRASLNELARLAKGAKPSQCVYILPEYSAVFTSVYGVNKKAVLGFADVLCRPSNTVEKGLIVFVRPDTRVGVRSRTLARPDCYIRLISGT